MTASGDAPVHATEERVGRLVADDGAELGYRAWTATRPKAAILLIHGLGEHSGRYAHLAEHLAGQGVSVYALDHRGHGTSGGRRGHVARLDRFTADLATFHRKVAETLPADLPRFLLGHSLGGLIAIRYLQQYAPADLAGAVLSAPALGVALEPPAWKVALARLLSRIVPWATFSQEIDPGVLTHDARMLEALRVDPLVHQRISARLYTEIVEAMRRALRETERITVPAVLFLVPMDDRVVSPRATLHFADRLGPDMEVEVRRYPELYHECFNELERARVFGDLLDWLRARAG